MSKNPENYSVEEWEAEIHAWAKRKGWWETFTLIRDIELPGHSPEVLEKFKNDLTLNVFIAKLALAQSEIAEAIEELRSNNLDIRIDNATGKPEGAPVEMADAVIRLLDANRAICEYTGVRATAGLAMKIKMDFNEKRPHRHGRHV